MGFFTTLCPATTPSAALTKQSPDCHGSHCLRARRLIMYWDQAENNSPAGSPVDVIVVVVAGAVHVLLGGGEGIVPAAGEAALLGARVVVAALVGDLLDEPVEGALHDLLDGAPVAGALVVAPRRLGVLELLLPVLAPAVTVLRRLLDGWRRRRQGVRVQAAAAAEERGRSQLHVMVVWIPGEEDGEVGVRHGGISSRRSGRRPLRRLVRDKVRRVWIHSAAQRRWGERGGLLLLVGRRRWRVVRLHGERKHACSLVVNFEVSLSFVNCTAICM